jgi:glutamate formiminotransferase/formiminotetrahydrofolate cyclodeaminase
VLTPLVECVPNFSEGRRPEVVARIVDAIRAVPGVAVLDQSSDADHNRTVVTFAGPPDAVEAAAFAAIATAATLIDLNQHQGEHPRIGATDVVPFIPLRGITMDDCVAIAQRLGERVGRELSIPVYLYESAATRPDRENLANLRKGEYEGLKDAIQTDPQRTPDFGPAALGPAGATVIGARPFLIAFNVYLNTADVEVATKIAKAIRHSGGGLRYVKALGLLVNGQAQVSMNLTDFRHTPMARVVELIRREAARYGVMPTHSELVGMIPEDALVDAAQWYLQLDLFTPDQILERQLAAAQAPAPEEDLALKPDVFVNAVSAGNAAPGGGAVAAAAGALSAALAEMVARLTVGKKRYEDVQDQAEAIAASAETLRGQLLAAIRADVAAFEQVMAAYTLPKDDPGRTGTIRRATYGAADVPLSVARAALAALKLAGQAAAIGNKNAVTDALAGVHMALAAVEIAALNVRVNVSGDESPAAAQYRQDITTVVDEARRVGAEVLAEGTRRAGL